MATTSAVLREHRIEPFPSVVSKQALFIFSVLQGILLLLYSLLRGDISPDVLHTRIQTAKETMTESTVVTMHTLESESNTPTSDSSESNASHVPLMSSMRALCKHIVQRDIKAVSR